MVLEAVSSTVPTCWMRPFSTATSITPSMWFSGSMTCPFFSSSIKIPPYTRPAPENGGRTARYCSFDRNGASDQKSNMPAGLVSGFFTSSYVFAVA